jgi:hypothetical protein
MEMLIKEYDFAISREKYLRVNIELAINGSIDIDEYGWRSLCTEHRHILGICELIRNELNKLNYNDYCN